LARIEAVRIGELAQTLTEPGFPRFGIPNDAVEARP